MQEPCSEVRGEVQAKQDLYDPKRHHDKHISTIPSFVALSNE